MKKKVLLILTLLILLCSCDNEEKKEVNELKQDLTVIEKDSNGEIIKGTLEGYTFVETDEVTKRVKLQMEDGSVLLIVLSNEDSPITIKNFQDLVKEKIYDGSTFHRVIKDFMIQGGIPKGDITPATIKGEFSQNGVNNNLSHTRGVVSMARNSISMDSASSQFFICHADSTYLDGQYASFGKVFAGMDLVDKIANEETDEYDAPYIDQKIKSIRFIEIEK